MLVSDVCMVDGVPEYSWYTQIFTAFIKFDPYELSPYYDPDALVDNLYQELWKIQDSYNSRLT